MARDSLSIILFSSSSRLLFGAIAGVFAVATGAPIKVVELMPPDGGRVTFLTSVYNAVEVAAVFFASSVLDAFGIFGALSAKPALDRVLLFGA